MRDRPPSITPSFPRTSHVVFGKAEGIGSSWHGHVTALTVAPEYRRQGLAERLMRMLEDVTEKQCVGTPIGGVAEGGVPGAFRRG